MVLVKLKQGIKSIGNRNFEIIEGQVASIPDKMFDADTMDKVNVEVKTKPKVERQIGLKPKKITIRRKRKGK